MSKLISILCASIMFAATLICLPQQNALAEEAESIPADVLEYAENTALPHFKSFLKVTEFGYIGENELFKSNEEIDALKLGSAYRVTKLNDFDENASIIDDGIALDEWLFSMDDANGGRLLFTVGMQEDGEYGLEGPWEMHDFENAMQIMSKTVRKAKVDSEVYVVKLGSGGGGFDLVASFNGDERVITVPLSGSIHDDYKLVKKYTELPTLCELIRKDAEKAITAKTRESGDGNVTIDMSSIEYGDGFIELAPTLERISVHPGVIIGAGVVIVTAVVALSITVTKKKHSEQSN